MPKDKLIKTCNRFIEEYLVDKDKKDSVKSYIAKRLFNIKPPTKSITLKIEIDGKEYIESFEIKHSRSEYPQLNDWRKKVLERDNYTCQECGAKKHLHVHHISRWADDPINRFNIFNGLTLCKKCHRKTETYGNKQFTFLK